MQQAQEMVKICAKHYTHLLKAGYPFKNIFNAWLGNTNIYERKASLVQLLMSRFKEMSCKIEVDSIEKVFHFTKEMMCLVKNKRRHRYRRIHNVKVGTAGK